MGGLIFGGRGYVLCRTSEYQVPNKHPDRSNSSVVDFLRNLRLHHGLRIYRILACKEENQQWPSTTQISPSTISPTTCIRAQIANIYIVASKQTATCPIRSFIPKSLGLLQLLPTSGSTVRPSLNASTNVRPERTYATHVSTTTRSNERRSIEMGSNSKTSIIRRAFPSIRSTARTSSSRCSTKPYGQQQ
jgi:hypothetical protein